MPGGRPLKSLKLLEASGATRKNPQRFRDRVEEPTVDLPLGPPPAKWTKDAETSGDSRRLVEAWEKITSRIAMLPEGVVTAADDLSVELACRLLVRIEGGYAKNSDISQYRALLGELGLTPTGRARHHGPGRTGDPEDGDFGEFVRKPARRSA
jgi:hypothetical protein